MDTSKTKKKTFNVLKNACKRYFCNKRCLGTIFEDGDADKLPTEYANTLKGNERLLEIFTKQRKELFGKESTVLKDNFYKGLDKNVVNKTRKKGAISGCLNVIRDDI